MEVLLMIGFGNAMAEMLEKQAELLASEGFLKTAEEAANRAELFRLMGKLVTSGEEALGTR